MNVKDGLSGAGPDIVNRAIARLNVAFAAQLSGDQLHVAKDRRVVSFGFFQSGNVFLGNNEKVRGRLRMNVFEDKNAIVFIYLF